LGIGVIKPKTPEGQKRYVKPQKKKPDPDRYFSDIGKTYQE